VSAQTAPAVSLASPLALSIETACELRCPDALEASTVDPLLEAAVPPESNAPSPTRVPAIGPSCETVPKEPSASSVSAGPTAPRPRRTRFSVCLQLGRAFSSLVALVRAGAEANCSAARAASHAVASHILRGARDRSRDRHIRALLDHQRRTHSLHEPRPARQRAPAPKKRRRGDLLAPAAPATPP
jgi:hypothetical protein